MILDEKAYNFAKKLLNIYTRQSPAKSTKSETSEEQNIHKVESDPSRIIGSTDYKKFEELAKSIDSEEKLKLSKEKSESDEKRNLMKMGCNNDLRKERQLMDKPAKDKIEASKIFKNEGDSLLKQNKFKEAIDSYEKGLLQLFYLFSDDPNEENEADKLRISINSNCAYCLIKLQNWGECLGYLNEIIRIDKKNIKAIYRMAFCYFKMEKFSEAIKYVDMGISVDKDNKLFIELKKDIHNKEKELENKQNELYKKIGISNK